jgi:thiol:disulfide interchange protein DsbD
MSQREGLVYRSARLLLLVSALCALMTPRGGFAQSDSDPTVWTLKPATAQVAPGAKFTADLTTKIAPGWHVYSITQPPGGPIATLITVPKGQPFTLAGAITGTMPEQAYDPNFDMQTEFYAENASFKVPLQVAADAPAGPKMLGVDVYFQVCNDRLCLPPTTVHVPLKVTIAPRAVGPVKDDVKSGGASIATEQNREAVSLASTQTRADARPTSSVAPAASSEPKQPPSTPFPHQDAQSLASFLWLAMGFGALSLLTPCVFPMIPITVSYFTNHAAEDRGAALRKALVYGVGIILTFTALGMLLALLVGAGGINLFAANPWVNLLITAIFLAFALNLFGAFQIQIPSSVLTRLDKATSRAGGSDVIGTLLMGFTFTLTSFTCTAPFVGTLLVMAAQGRWQWPLMGMLAFSFVFALPFFFLAWMPQYLARLPKSGGWLNSVKVVMGFLEVAAAMKFLSNADLVWRWNIFTREVCLAVWVAIGVLTTLYLLGQFKLTHDSPVERLGALRLIWTMLCLAMTFYLLTGLFGRQLGEIESFLPPAPGNGSQANGANRDTTGELSWILNDYGGALAKAKQEQKRVFIDFTGYTCTNCRWMEANMFSRPEVQKGLERFVRVRLYTDGAGRIFEDQQKMQQQMFGTVALPYYAVVDANGDAVVTFPGLTRHAAEFIQFLEKGLAQ